VIQLRLRTEFSFGRTFAPIERTVTYLKEIGCTAAAIVDTASTWGHVKWHETCLKHGIQPLLGVELAVGAEGLNMWFLAKNEAGLSELYKFTSRAFRQKLATNTSSVPCLTYDDVRSMSDDIIKFSGEMLDEELLLDVDAVIDFSPVSRVLSFQKRQLAERLKLRTVNTSDNAYAKLGDKAVFELISDSGTKPTPQHILTDLQDTADAAAIAAACKDLTLPKAPMIRLEGDLEKMCRDGIEFRGLTETFKNDPRYEERLRHELSTIAEKEYDSYFLVVADMVRYAKQHMLVGPSRGSAAGSLVCYLTRITEVDPIPPGLFFERFIDMNRKDLPDIDLDFPDKKREMVFTYMAEKYGNGRTAHIGTVATFKPKSALIQVCKKLNIPPQATGGVKAAMIERSSADRRANNCLLDTLNDTEPGRQLIKMYPQVMLAAEIEAHASHTGTHAAGLLVCNANIDNFATIDDNNIAQVDMASIKSIGLLKIDVLGLRTLSVLEDSGVPVDWYRMKFDDPATFKIFSDNKLSSIFQFEGQAMRSIAERITFNSLNDVDAVTALARPGPFGGGVTNEYLERRNGKPYKPIHPAVEKHMSETYGLPIYQEQTMSIVRHIGGFNWKAIGAVRTAISKRLGKELFDSFWPGYLEGATKVGMTEAEAKASWDLINAMGAWQMNKAHTHSYAVISYWCAWLKAHHPLEFALANMINAKDEETALRLLRELWKEGLRFIPFDPMLSEEDWCIKDGKLIAGYKVLKGFGESKAADYIAARKAGKLTPEMIAKALKAENPFADLFPMQTKFGHLYDKPEKHGIFGKVFKLEELDGTQQGSTVFIAKIIKKIPRTINEDVLIKKRNGKVHKGPQPFLDFHLRDDTGIILARIDRFKYARIGLELFERIPLETPLLIRAHFVKDIRMAFVEKWKAL
jgi:DNA polymerase III alpha subunit